LPLGQHEKVGLHGALRTDGGEHELGAHSQRVALAFAVPADDFVGAHRVARLKAEALALGVAQFLAVGRREQAFVVAGQVDVVVPVEIELSGAGC